MPLSETQRVALLASTKPQAQALVEDAAHIRAVIESIEQTRGEIRRISAILRRLLVEDDLIAIATPRLGRIYLTGPDNSIAYKQINATTTDLFVSGSADIFGLQIRAAMNAQPSVKLPGFDPEATVPLRVENFLNQQVVFWKGAWISRRAIIKYVANVAQGVHSGTPKEADASLIAEIRHRLIVGRRPDGGVRIWIDQEVDERSLGFVAPGIDLALVELISTAGYLVRSPMFIELERRINDEAI